MFWHVVLTTLQVSAAEPSSQETVLQERTFPSEVNTSQGCIQYMEILHSIQSRTMGPGVRVDAKCITLEERFEDNEPLRVAGW